MGLQGPALGYTSRVALDDAPPSALRADQAAVDTPDRRDGAVYEYTADLKLALEVALYTGRPLLLRGDPGTGKSSFAAYVARNLGWRYYEHVVTARTQAENLLWRFDAVSRLADAQVQGARGSEELNDFDYVQPGVLWWALDRASAARRGATAADRAPRTPATEPFDVLNADRHASHAVVLIDEIDKADPDVPNNLLVPLGSSRFRVRETGSLVPEPAPASPPPDAALPPPPPPDPNAEPAHAQHLFVLTTNEERELPAAFLRRCVVHVLEHPDADGLLGRAKLHFTAQGTPLDAAQSALAKTIADDFVQLRQTAKREGKRPPSTAEYLDTIRACFALDVPFDADAWRVLRSVAIEKRSPAESDPA